MYCFQLYFDTVYIVCKTLKMKRERKWKSNSTNDGSAYTASGSEVWITVKQMKAKHKDLKWNFYEKQKGA